MALTKITPQMFDTSAAGHDFNIDNGTFVVDASADSVGIGTASPAQKLEVSGTAATSRFTRLGSSGTNMEFYIGSTFSGGVQVNSTGLGLGGGSEENQIFLKNDGTVGIGTTSPSNKLDVNGAFTASSVGVDNLLIDGNEIDSTSGHIVLDSADEIKLDAHSGIIRVQTPVSYTHLTLPTIREV